MHTVRRTSKHFLVQFVEQTADAGYRPSRDNLVWFRNEWDAFAFCSFLNGGAWPRLSEKGLEDVATSPTLADKGTTDVESEE